MTEFASGALPTIVTGAARGFEAIVTRTASAASIFCLAIMPVSIAAQNHAQTTNVMLKNFKFAPAQIELTAGDPIILRLENDSSAGHSFVAPKFFSSSKLDPAAEGRIINGRVEVPPHSSVALKLTPARGSYSLKCGHAMHALFGMTGSIVVR